METRTKKSETKIYRGFDLINNFELPKDKEKSTNTTNIISGLGKVAEYQYNYSDICPNAMK